MISRSSSDGFCASFISESFLFMKMAIITNAPRTIISVMRGSIKRHSTIRKQQVLKRKNFFPTLAVAIILWILSAGVVYFVEPEQFGILPLFFVLIFLSLLFTFSLVFGNSRRGLITSFGLTLFLVLRYLGVGNILNFVLIAAAILTFELYFVRR